VLLITNASFRGDRYFESAGHQDQPGREVGCPDQLADTDPYSRAIMFCSWAGIR